MIITCIIWFLAILTATVYIFFKKTFSFWSRNSVPHLKPHIPYGNFNHTEQPAFLAKRFYNLFKNQGPICGLYMYHATMAIATDIELIKNILIKDFDYFQDRGLYYNEKDDPLSAHLLTLSSEKWRPLRNKLSPTFSSGKIKFMYPTMIIVANQLERAVNNLIDDTIAIGGDVEIYDLLSRYTTDNIGTCVFGIECNSLQDPNAEFRRMGVKTMENSYGILASWLLIFSKKLAQKLGVRQIDKSVSKFFMEIIYDTVAYREANNIRRNDFLDICIDLKNNAENSLTINEIAAQAYIFFLAGFDTSSSTMTFTLYELARHLDVQEKARDEINRVLQKYNGDLCYDAIMEMKYVNQIIQGFLFLFNPKNCNLILVFILQKFYDYIHRLAIFCELLPKII